MDIIDELLGPGEPAGSQEEIEGEWIRIMSALHDALRVRGLDKIGPATQVRLLLEAHGWSYADCVDHGFSQNLLNQARGGAFFGADLLFRIARETGHIFIIGPDMPEGERRALRPGEVEAKNRPRPPKVKRERPLTPEALEKIEIRREMLACLSAGMLAADISRRAKVDQSQVFRFRANERGVGVSLECARRIRAALREWAEEKKRAAKT